MTSLQSLKVIHDVACCSKDRICKSLHPYTHVLASSLQQARVLRESPVDEQIRFSQRIPKIGIGINYGRAQSMSGRRALVALNCGGQQRNAMSS